MNRTRTAATVLAVIVLAAVLGVVTRPTPAGATGCATGACQPVQGPALAPPGDNAPPPAPVRTLPPRANPIGPPPFHGQPIISATFPVNGHGVRTLPTFRSTGARWSITYSYTCAKPGRFVLSDGGPYWAVVFVDATALTGSGRLAETATGKHGIGINSTCRWSVKVDHSSSAAVVHLPRLPKGAKYVIVDRDSVDCPAVILNQPTCYAAPKR